MTKLRLMKRGGSERQSNVGPMFELESVPVIWYNPRKNYVNNYNRNETMQKLLITYINEAKPLESVKK